MSFRLSFLAVSLALASSPALAEDIIADPTVSIGPINGKPILSKPIFIKVAPQFSAGPSNRTVRTPVDSNGLTLSPDHLNFSVVAGSTQGFPFTLGNAGAGVLTFDIGPNAASANLPPIIVPVSTPVSFTQSADQAHTDTGSTCNNGVDTLQTSIWRRFPLTEVAGIANTITVTGVDLSSAGPEFNGTGSVASEVLVYTLPHQTPADTIPLSGLSLVGTSLRTFAAGETATVPVSGVIDGTQTQDLVVEWRIPQTLDTHFYPAATDAGETHPSFISSPGPDACNVDAPIPLLNAGNAANVLMVVRAIQAGGTEAFDCNPPVWLKYEKGRRGTIASGSSTYSKAQVDTSALAAGDYDTGICIRTHGGSGNPVSKSDLRRSVIPVHVHVAQPL